VVLRKNRDGRPVARTVAKIPFTGRDEVLRMTRLHLDASRSAALFAERLLLVEGVTDAALMRQFGWVWAGDDADRQAFVDALSIVAVGTKVGSWPIRLLATGDHELCSRVAVLRDSDVDFGQSPTPPAWAASHDPDVVLIEHSHPTLEPAVTGGNETLVKAALGDIHLDIPEAVTPQAVHELFRSARKAAAECPVVPAGPGARRKGEFAQALAAHIADARSRRVTVTVPPSMARILDFLYAPAPSRPATDAPATPPAPADEDATAPAHAAAGSNL
jgi:putative ATP-dependent endonuclease of OLD family